MPAVLRFALVCSIALALTISSCGNPTEVALNDQIQAILNGVPDTDPAHNSVVAVVQRYKGYPNLWSLCTGTVIAPGVVMTAGHCADGGASVYYTIVFGAATQGAEERPVNSLWVHPDWNTYEISQDIALMRFSGGMPEGVVPIPHLPARLALTQDDVGAQVRFIGYGRTELGAISTKLTATNFLSHICETEEDCLGSGISNESHIICYILDQGPGGTCNGDSGGPWTVIREGQEYVAGITSYGPAGCAYWGCGTKVDSFADFIEAFIAADKKLGEACSENIACLSGFCADGVCCDYACDGPCEACNQAGAEGSCEPVSDNALEAGCQAGGGGCAAVPGPDGRAPWVGLAALGLLGLALIIRLRRG